MVVKETVFGIVLAFVVYVLGTYSVYRIANDMITSIAPWVGVLSAVIYIVIITAFMVFVSGKVN